MIVKLCGNLVSVEKNTAYLEINGITYAILITESAEQRLVASGKVGNEVTFHIFHYIEGSMGVGNLVPRLVGFLNETDLEFFTILIGVQGLGVKKALRSLVIPIKDVARAIEMNDIATLKKLPEIGGKTAQKIVVELKGKAAKFALLREEDIPVIEQVHEIEEEYQQEALEILRQLQYNEDEALDIVRKVAAQSPQITSSEELIQEIFKRQIM